MEMDYTNLFAAVLLSFVIERILAVFFDLSGLDKELKLDGVWSKQNAPNYFNNSFKGIVAAVVAVIICLLADINVINEIIKNSKGADPSGLPSWLGEIMSGIFIAGGSQGSVKLFQDVLGFSKDNREKVNNLQEKNMKAQEEKASRDEVAAKLERTRMENALFVEENKDKVLKFQVETDAQIAEIERRKKIKDVQKRAGVSIDPKLLSSPADVYLKDVIENWDEFIVLRAELKSGVATGSH